MNSPRMIIIEVIPITKGIGIETLSYFTTKDVSVGALVDVPIRSKRVRGLVVNKREAIDIKSEIKNAPYALKKVEKLGAVEFLTPAFKETARDSATYYATTVGNILDALLPEYILKNAEKFARHKSEDIQKERAPEKSFDTEMFAVQGDDDERISTWRSLIRQEFAKKSSVIIMTPGIEDAVRTFELVEKGIEGYAFVLHSNLKSREIISTWNKIIREKHPVAIIITPGFFSIERHDVSTIVIEKENSRGYKSQRRPFNDLRIIAEIHSLNLAKTHGRSIRLFIGDTLLSTEALARESDAEITRASPFKFRSLSTADDLLVDMRKYKDPRGIFRIISKEVEDLIIRTKEKSENMMILATRRGVAGTTVCGDCQSIVTCNNCSAPVVLHGPKASTDGNTAVPSGKSFFLCHHCGEKRSTEEYCKVCKSWKLGTVGIGIDMVNDKIRDKFPDTTIFRIDADSTPTDKEARETARNFKAQPGSILLGTEMMLSYMHDRIENSAVISIDSLLALPDFRIQEKILYTLVRMRAKTSKQLIVQTRKPDERLFEYALKGNLIDFYRLTIEERKKYNYPPFTTLVKLTLEGKKDEIVSEMTSIQARLSSALTPEAIDVFPAFTHTIRGNYVLHCLVRIPREKWPDIAVIDILRSLPPWITVKVDPETLL